MRKVRIISQPNAAYGGNISQGLNSNQYTARYHPEMMSEPDIKTRRLLQPVAREGANVEAEKGETVVTNFNGDSIPEHYNIGGKRHTQGGTPLNLPEDSFIFSDTKNMRIKDPNVLQMFGKSSGSFTPAELAKKYNINKYRATLGDPDTDKIQKESAERMIASYNKKLAKLALIQESMKGFPQGIPKIAEPYMATSGMDPNQFLSAEGANSQDVPEINAAYGGYMQDGGSYGVDNADDYLRKIKGYSRQIEDIEKLIPFYGKDATPMEWVSSAFNLPIKTMNKYTTGNYETPGQSMIRHYPDVTRALPILTDAALDPLTYAGVNELKGGYHLAKALGKSPVDLTKYIIKKAPAVYEASVILTKKAAEKAAQLAKYLNPTILENTGRIGIAAGSRAFGSDYDNNNTQNQQLAPTIKTKPSYTPTPKKTTKTNWL